MKISEIKNGRNINKYNGKDKRFLISPQMLDLKTNNYSSININKVLKQAKNKREFDNLIAYELFNNISESEFYDFSLLMGLNLGVYNCYGYLYVSSELKERVLRSNPNVDETLFIINNYKKDLDILFKKKYNLSSDDLTTIINKMLQIDRNNSLYNNEIIFDVCKTILGIRMLYGSYDTSLTTMRNVKVREDIRTGRCLEYFDEINNKKNESNLGK